MRDLFIYEMKVKVDNLSAYHDYLIRNNALAKGTDHQVDTYFNVPTGRLKIRTGNIENTLIQYNRIERKGIKESSVRLQKLPIDHQGLLDIMTDLLGVNAIVDKKRSIYFIENVKFHLDEVKDLGYFVEIEAISENENIELPKLKSQLDKYVKELGLISDQMIDCSYSDMILAEKKA